MTDDEMAFAHVAQAMKDPAMRSATVVLPVPGLPVKPCAAWAGRTRARPVREPLHQQKRRDLANALLDRREPDEIAIEFGNGRADSVSACSALRSTTSPATASNVAAGPGMLIVALASCRTCRIGPVTSAGRPIDGIGRTA